MPWMAGSQRVDCRCMKLHARSRFFKLMFMNGRVVALRLTAPAQETTRSSLSVASPSLAHCRAQPRRGIWDFRLITLRRSGAG